MKWTMKKIIDDTVQFFGADPESNRCMDDDSTCMYTNDQGKHCAIGRFLLPEHQTLEFANVHIQDNVENLEGVINLDDVLIPEVRGFPVDFWNDLQVLHDGRYYWSESRNCIGIAGLTIRGEDFYYEILSRYVRVE